MKWKHLPIVAFDTETTGLEPFGGDRVIEFAAVELHVDDRGEVVDRTDHSWLINPERDIGRKVTEITGISNADVAAQPRFAEVAKPIRDLLAGAVTVAHNFPFDLAFLSMEFERVREESGDPRMRWPEPLAEIDTVDLSMRCFPEARSHRLADLADRLSVSLENAHRATDDAAACGLCFAKLSRQNEIDDDLQTMLDWAGAIGQPPAESAIGPDPNGQLVFLEGPKEGRPVAQHPIQLGWMEKARVRTAQGWQYRYPEGVRRWIRRWLQVRGAGRAIQNPKSFHAQDWVLDPCLATPRRARTM
ncbi:MAG: 3'-5' exonuclease [Myxococcota bacterium]